MGVQQSKSAFYKAILKWGKPKQNNYNFEIGFQISTKFDIDVADGLLLLCAKLGRVWGKHFQVLIF